MQMKALGMMLWCVLAMPVAHAETFVIEADKSGHEATVTIPVGAVTKMSANSAQSLDGYAGSQVEVMRLSGDVSISIAGSTQPIEIKADRVLIELTADSQPTTSAKNSRANLAANKILRATTSTSGAEDFQVFVGNVVFDLQTPAGTMEIKADKVEHQLRNEAGV